MLHSQGRRPYKAIRFVVPSTSRGVPQLIVPSPDLSSATVHRNSDLENRVAELELELSVWKQAHANILESAEREKKAHNAQVSTLNRQISSLETIKAGLSVLIGRKVTRVTADAKLEPKPAHLLRHRRLGQRLPRVLLKTGTAGGHPGGAEHDKGHRRISFPGKRAGLWPHLLLDNSILKQTIRARRSRQQRNMHSRTV